MTRAVVAEALGTGLLLATVVGSGILAERLCGGNVGLALLCNALATGAGLFALIETFGPVSGAHFNPAVTMAMALERRLPGRVALAYVGAQVVGAIGGVAVANRMFELPFFTLSAHARTGGGQWLAEAVATFGLLVTILGARRERGAFAVASYVVAAYWFTASTAFANPAVTLARALTDTFAGIRLDDVPPFVAAQVVGAVAAWGTFRWLLRPTASPPDATRPAPPTR